MALQRWMASTPVQDVNRSSSLVVVGTKPTNSVRGSEIEVYVMRRRVEGPELGVSVPALRRLHGFQYYRSCVEKG
jgi:hypothetical protein